MVTQLTQQLSCRGGVAVVVCMDGRWRSSRADKMEGRIKGPDKRNAQRERERGSEVKEGRRSEWRKNEQGGIEWEWEG